MKHFLTLACLALYGCATCDRHPLACTAGAVALAVAVESINLSSHREPAYGPIRTTEPVTCNPSTACR